MEIIITEIAQRIRDLREIMGYSVEEMAQAVDCTPEEYIAAENGEVDFLSHLFTNAPRSSMLI